MRPGSSLLRLATAGFGLACLSVVFTGAARAQGACPLNYLSFNWGSLTSHYTDAVKDTFFATPSGFSAAGYDLVRGQVRARALGNASAEAGVSDDYTVSGGTPGTPFTIRARLDLATSTESSCDDHGHCSSASARAILREGSSNEATYSSSQSPIASIEVTVQGTVGVPFRLFALAGASTCACGGPGPSAELQALLRFADLSAGLRITSCQGYVQDAPVAISRSTWGRLKGTNRWP